MPQQDVRELQQAIGGLAHSSPLVAVGKGLSKVGATVQDLAGRATRALTPTKAPARDRVLPRAGVRRRTRGKALSRK